MEFDLEKLPLIEVTIRLAPEKSFNLSYTVCTKLTEALHTKVSAARYLDAPVFDVGKRNTHRFRPGEIYGLQLVDFDTGIALGIQPNSFAVQWVRTVQTYPGYPVLVKFLEEVAELAKGVYKKDWPRFKIANMTYENFIVTEEDPTGADYQNYFKGGVKLGAMGGKKRFHNLNAAWREEGGADVRVDITGIIHTGDGDKTTTGLLFSNTAGKILEPAEEWPRETMDANRELLNGNFKSWITSTAQREWCK
ncbi:hypothetical protein DYH09_04405 [bacterium CPR1]|nr:hypothetical protein [bacterium CPR1]